jgi:hypothetical protein
LAVAAEALRNSVNSTVTFVVARLEEQADALQALLERRPWSAWGFLTHGFDATAANDAADEAADELLAGHPCSAGAHEWVEDGASGRLFDQVLHQANWLLIGVNAPH